MKLRVIPPDFYCVDLISVLALESSSYKCLPDKLSRRKELNECDAKTTTLTADSKSIYSSENKLRFTSNYSSKSSSEHQ